MSEAELIKKIYEDFCSDERHCLPERWIPYAKHFGIRYLDTLPKEFLKHAERNGLPLERFQKRTVIPIYQDDTLVGLTGRSVEDDQPKYYHLLNKSKLLYARPDFSPKDTLYVVEGFADVMACWKQGVDAVALMGTSASKQQIELLKSFQLPICLMFDGDRAGKEGMMKFPSKHFKDISVVELQFYDPDEYLHLGFSLPKPVPYAEWWTETAWQSNLDEKEFLRETALRGYAEYVNRLLDT